MRKNKNTIKRKPNLGNLQNKTYKIPLFVLVSLVLLLLILFLTIIIAFFYNYSHMIELQQSLEFTHKELEHFKETFILLEEKADSIIKKKPTWPIRVFQYLVREFLDFVSYERESRFGYNTFSLCT